MDYKLNIENLSNPADLQKLKSAISELAFDLDAIYTATAPNGNISARQGVRAIYLNGATYEYWVNVDGGLTWQRYAGQSDVVLLTGDQTIAGIKTFSSIPILPASDPTTDHQAARKLYVDGKFNTTTGHDHDGSDSKVVSYNNLADKPALSGIQIFTSDGNFTAPVGITKVYITMVGGGGGGGSGTSGSGGGDGGGGGETLINVPYTVTPESVYAVDIGAGGAGGAAGGSHDGVAGSNTTFNSTGVVASGGALGQHGAGGDGGAGGGASLDASGTTPGGDGIKGGKGGAGVSGAGDGGAGGGTPFGTGGATQTSDSGLPGSGYGSGGAGGASNGLAGGNGASGICIIMY